MSRTKSYPKGFQQAIKDISGGVCEKCSGNQGVQTHHIWGRGMMGKTIHRLWNAIALCFDCHENGNWDDKIALLDLRLRRLLSYCQRWGQRPNAAWTRLEPGTLYNLDVVRQQIRSEGICGDIECLFDNKQFDREDPTESARESTLMKR
jgi:hypothetical protein